MKIEFIDKLFMAFFLTIPFIVSLGGIIYIYISYVKHIFK